MPVRFHGKGITSAPLCTVLPRQASLVDPPALVRSKSHRIHGPDQRLVVRENPGGFCASKPGVLGELRRFVEEEGEQPFVPVLLTEAEQHHAPAIHLG